MQQGDERMLSGIYQSQGEDACKWSYYISMGNNTCVGKDACYLAGFSHFEAGDNSCHGEAACTRAGGENGVFRVGDGSCKQDEACSAARHVGEFRAADGCCVGEKACYKAGFLGSFRAGYAGSMRGVPANSCVGYKACWQAAHEYTGAVVVGAGSCVGPYACQSVAYNQRSDITIGDASCLGAKACSSIAQGKVIIGDNSCTCEGCCENLPAGSHIGDCQCTSLADNCGNAASKVIRLGSCQPSTSPSISMEPSSSLMPSSSPSNLPSMSSVPSVRPSASPSSSPTPSPSGAPSGSSSPSFLPSSTPSHSMVPSSVPSPGPTTSHVPSTTPSQNPSFSSRPSLHPSTSPSNVPSTGHSQNPSFSTHPSSQPSPSPSESSAPSSAPSVCILPNQNLTIDESNMVIGLTDSDATVSFSHLVTKKENEIQNVLFDYGTNQLRLTKSTNVVDLSHLDNPAQYLTLDKDTMRLGLSGSPIDIRLPTMQQDLSTSNKVVDISGGGSSADLSPLRVIHLQATMYNGDGDDTAGTERRNLVAIPVDNAGARKLRRGGEEGPSIRYGGKIENGFAVFSPGQLVLMTVTANSVLTTGDLVISIVDRTDVENIKSIGLLEDVLVLHAGHGRSNSKIFATPIPVDAGVVLCFEAIGFGRIDANGQDVAASLVLRLEQ